MNIGGSPKWLHSERRRQMKARRSVAKRFAADPPDRIAVVAQGGGMRGALIAGMLQEVSHYLRRIDIAASSSASVATTAQYVTGHMDEAMELWRGSIAENKDFQHPSTKKELFRRLIASWWDRTSMKDLDGLVKDRDPLMNIETLIYQYLSKDAHVDGVRTGVKLDIESLMSSAPIIISTLINSTYETCYWTTAEQDRHGKPVEHAQFAHDVLKVMQASKSIPGFAPSVEIDDTQHSDGSYADALPIKHPEMQDRRVFKVILASRPIKRSSSMHRAKEAAFLKMLSFLGHRDFVALHERGERRYESELIPHMLSEERNGNAIVLAPLVSIDPLDNSHETIGSSIQIGRDIVAHSPAFVQLVRGIRGLNNQSEYYLDPH